VSARQTLPVPCLPGTRPRSARGAAGPDPDLWTHGSTAIEGNTLTLGETKFVIEEGLTISGKPLKDHQEVMGHARAIEPIYAWLDEDLTTEQLGFMHIHPFWDGNGRFARLLSNVPVLRAGHLPVVIEVRDRKRDIDTLSGYQLTVGPLTPTTGVWPKADLEADFRAFCRAAYVAIRALVEQAQAHQAKRSSH